MKNYSHHLKGKTYFIANQVSSKARNTAILDFPPPKKLQYKLLRTWLSPDVNFSEFKIKLEKTQRNVK